MYIYLRSSNSLHSILASVLCRKWSNIDWNYMLRGSDYFCRTMYLSANRSKVINSRWLRFLFIRMLSIFANSEGIWNNYVDIQQKFMQVRFITSLCTWGYISLGYPTWQHEVWRKILLNTNSWHLTEPFESMHTLFLPTKSAAAHLFHWY